MATIILIYWGSSGSGPTGDSNNLVDTIASTAKSDKTCAFNSNGLAKCKPESTTGKCPSRFSAYDKWNRFPKGPCLTGYTRPDNDESGKCFKK